MNRKQIILELSLCVAELRQQSRLTAASLIASVGECVELRKERDVLLAETESLRKALKRAGRLLNRHDLSTLSFVLQKYSGKKAVEK